MTMTLHRTVMNVDPARINERSEEVWFTSEEEGEGSDLYEDLMLDWDVWTRMGKPHSITISVVPGDALNDDDTITEYQGLEHRCNERDCHVPGFVKTLVENPPHMSTQLSDVQDGIGGQPVNPVQVD